SSLVCSFFFNPTATTAIYTLSLHDALPILAAAVDVDRGVDDAVLHGRSALLRAGVHGVLGCVGVVLAGRDGGGAQAGQPRTHARSEEHTSELQSRENLVCRLLLEKKKKTNK